MIYIPAFCRCSTSLSRLIYLSLIAHLQSCLHDAVRFIFRVTFFVSVRWTSLKVLACWGHSAGIAKIMVLCSEQIVILSARSSMRSMNVYRKRKACGIITASLFSFDVLGIQFLCHLCFHADESANICGSYHYIRPHLLIHFPLLGTIPPLL